MPLLQNENMSEALASLARIAPASKAAAAYALGPIQMNRFGRVQMRLSIGTIAGGSTVDAKFQCSNATGGTYVDVTGASIVQVVATPTNIITLELKAETVAAMTAANCGNWIKGVITVGTAAAILGAELLGGPGGYAPASDYGLAPDQAVVV